MKSRQLGGPKEFNPDQVERLYEIRRQMGIPGKHLANLCPNAKADVELVSSITKKVMEQLGL